MSSHGLWIFPGGTGGSGNTGGSGMSSYFFLSTLATKAAPAKAILRHGAVQLCSINIAA